MASIGTEAAALLVAALRVLWAENVSVSIPAWSNTALIQRAIVLDVTALKGSNVGYQKFCGNSKGGSNGEVLL